MYHLGRPAVNLGLTQSPGSSSAGSAAGHMLTTWTADLDPSVHHVKTGLKYEGGKMSA